MSDMTVAQRMTAEEYLSRDEPDDVRSELVEGEVVVNHPSVRHQRVRDDIHFALMTWTRAASGRGHASSPLDVLIDDHNVYGPDILWHSDQRAPERSHLGPSPMPDLAVEVRSPSTWRYDVGPKKSGYERTGLPELWLVDTAADVVLVFRRATPGSPSFDVVLELDRDAGLTSPLLPGFALPLAELFTEPRRPRSPVDSG